MEFKDYYATLGLGKTASAKDIKQAYRKLARKFHPDVNPGDKAAEARFKEINEAYEVLGDPEKRRKYDELGSNWRHYEQARRSGQDPFAHVRWAQPDGSTGYRTITEEDLREALGGQSPFSDFFQTFFAGAGVRVGGRRTRASRTSKARGARDIEQEIELSLEEAVQGAMRRLNIEERGHTRTVDVRIPAGVTDGSRVRLPGEGAHTSGGPIGDLYLKIRLQPDERFERRGRDLHTQVSVPLTTAVLGGEADVPVIGDRPVRLKIPATTQNGQVFRLKGHGMPTAGKPGERGDLYATVSVELPRDLTPEQRRHYEALARLEKSDV